MPNSQPTSPSAAPDPRRWWALALLCGAFFMVILDSNIVVVALPSIDSDLGFTEQGLQWVVSAYALTFAGLLLLGGRAADLLGRRRVFMFGIALFTFASALCGLAWSSEALIGARALEGVGAAIMTPTALSLVSTTFEEGPERNRALAIWGMNGAFGATAGYLVGGVLVDGPGWEWIFLINLPVGLLGLALCPVLLPESRATATTRSYDPLGALTITAALVVLVYALVETPDAGWGSAQTLLLFAASAALLAVFAALESRHRAPLVPLRILRNRTLVGANGLMLFFGTLGSGMPFVLTLYSQQVLGYTPLEFGLSFVISPIVAAVSVAMAQSALGKVGFRPVAVTGMVLLGGGSLMLTQIEVGGSYWGDVFPGLVVFGLGIGPAFVTATVAALAGVAERESGLASGLSNTAFQLGGALGVATVTTVVVSWTDGGSAHALTEGFRAGFFACGALGALGMLVAILLLGPTGARRLTPVTEKA